MLKYIVLALALVLLSSYAFGWFSEVAIKEKTTGEFNAEFVYWWKSYIYQVEMEALNTWEAFRASISKPS